MATWAELRARAASAAASAGSSLPEKRDDIETANNSELQTDRISECSGSSDSGSSKTEEKLMHEDNVDEISGEEFNDDNHDKSSNENMVDESHFYDDDDSKIDINSVISGNIENDVDEDVGDDNRDNDIHTEVVFGKNLGDIFANAEGIARKSNQVLDDYEPRSNSNNNNSNNTQVTVKRANSSSNLQPSRPPLAPGRPATANALMRGVATNNNDDDRNNNNLKRKATDQAPVVEGSTRLSVWLRVRPPVCSNGNKGVDGAINTIEVLVDNNDMTITPSSTLPTTIRTYPPPNSNAAKVVRGGGGGSSNNKIVSTKSLIDEGRDSDGGGSVDSTAEVRGVKEYSYSGVFGPNSTQSDVYDNVARPLVDGLFIQSTTNAGDNVVSLGESALLFTLGVTNGGKTHTVLGSGFERKMDNNNTNVPNNDWGIIPRSLDHIIARVNAMNAEATSGPRLQVYLSYLEIYNEGIYDLLPLKSDVPRRPCDGPPTLKLRESRHGRIFVRGLARHAVNNVQQGFELLKTAKNTRHTASNNINANSSRSHSICQLEIAFAPGVTTVDNSKGRSHAVADSECDTDDESVCSSKSNSNGQPSDNSNRQRKASIIWIVDLAGSERSKRTHSHSHSIHQREAALINASLMNLMRCLREMLNHQPKKRGVATKGGVVPFRESKLTHMFMNHLTGPAASRTTMIVNVNPGADDYDETQHVLGYAATARNVTISAIDYNRQRQKFVKESAATSTSSPKKALSFAKISGNRLAKIVSKLSPKKRKIITAESSSVPETKRLRCNSDSDVEKSTTNPIARGSNDQLQRLREENFIIKSTVDDLRQQLTECENEVREEVVAMMSEQLQESKDWYETRIMQLKQQLAYVQSTKSAGRADGESSNSEITDLFERIVECEDEMKRMREDHIAEVEVLNARIFQLNSDHQFAIDNRITEHKLELQLEQAKSKRLESELGALRHQSRELQFSHDNLLAKYNDLVESTQLCPDKELVEDINHEKENPSSSVASIQESSPSIRKLRREKVSGVASTATAVDLSPKKKTNGWFGKSPLKLSAGEMSPTESTTDRSPLGKMNKP
jgi:hypothetical protein